MTRRFGESESKFLKGSDLMDDDGRYRELDLMVDYLKEETVGQGEKATSKTILYFRGKEKGIALNTTNEKMLLSLFGEPDSWGMDGLTAHFSGRTVHLYFDPSIMFGTERTGGLRLARAKGGAVAGGEPRDEYDRDHPSGENPPSAQRPDEGDEVIF